LLKEAGLARAATEDVAVTSLLLTELEELGSRPAAEAERE
jgi:hypothetical protein